MKDLIIRLQEQQEKIHQLQELEKMRKMGRIMSNQAVGNSSPVACSPERERPKRSKQQQFKEELSHLDARKQYLIDIIDKLENFKYQIGDVVVHPEMGNCIVQDIQLANEQPELTLRNHSNVEGDALFVTCAGYEYASGYSADQFVPYNTTSKILYAKK